MLFDKFKKDLFNFRFQKMNSQVTNPAKIGETKKTMELAYKKRKLNKSEKKLSIASLITEKNKFNNLIIWNKKR